VFVLKRDINTIPHSTISYSHNWLSCHVNSKDLSPAPWMKVKVLPYQESNLRCPTQWGNKGKSHLAIFAWAWAKATDHKFKVSFLEN